MKKFFYFASLILEIAAIAGMYAFNYFARAKLGMNRWLVYNNQKWEASLCPETLVLVWAVFLLLLLIAAIAVFIRSENKHVLKKASLIVSICMIIAFACFATFGSTSVYKAFYLMELCLGAACLIQLVRSLVLAKLDLTLKFPRIDETTLSEEERKQLKTRRIVRRITAAVVLAFIAICIFVQPVNAEITGIFKLLSSGNIAAVANRIASYGPAAAIVSFLLMILQSLAAPIPAFLITFANASVFGWWQGALLSWTSAMAGAALCFYIARVLGRDAVAHFVTSGALATVDRFFEHYGSNAILICRLLPFMSFDYVSYAAGLTKMRFRDFMIATGIGQLPATIVYSYVGGMLTGGAQVVMTALLIMFALAVLVFLIRQVFTARHESLMEDSE